MTKLKLGTFVDEKPVKLTLELPAALHRDLVAYAAIRARGYHPTKLIAPMLEGLWRPIECFAGKFARTDHCGLHRETMRPNVAYLTVSPGTLIAFKLRDMALARLSSRLVPGIIAQ